MTAKFGWLEAPRRGERRAQCSSEIVYDKIGNREPVLNHCLRRAQYVVDGRPLCKQHAASIALEECLERDRP